MAKQRAANPQGEIDNLIQRLNTLCHEHIAWYQSKKRVQRRLFYASSASLIIVGSLISVLGNLPGEASRIASAFSGVAVVILTGLSSLFRWQSNWIHYTDAQDRLEFLFVRVQAQFDRLHALPNDEARLEAMRHIFDRSLAEIQIIRGGETKATMPYSKVEHDDQSQDGKR